MFGLKLSYDLPYLVLEVGVVHTNPHHLVLFFLRLLSSQLMLHTSLYYNHRSNHGKSLQLRELDTLLNADGGHELVAVEQNTRQGRSYSINLQLKLFT